jgi:WD40 repeat protein
LVGAIFKNTLVTGTSNANLHVWAGNSIHKSHNKVHDGPINALFVHKDDNTKLYSGSNDGVIKIWDTNFSCSKIIKLNELKLDLTDFKIRSICTNSKGDLLIGTRGSEIVEIINQSKGTILMRGHYNNELWGLTIHPKK